jgi:nicotine blue oxidoreductase
MIPRLGLLIAGGRGERLGSPKAGVMLAGRTLLERAHATLAAACDAVRVVAPADLDLPVAPALRIRDAMDHAGPLSALVAGLGAVKYGRAIALAVDMPLVRPSHLAALLAEADGPAAWVPAPGGRPQPLAAAYAPAAAARLAAALAAGERALVPAVLALAPRILDDAALRGLGLAPECLDDVDTPEDLERVERLLRSGEAGLR